MAQPTQPLWVTVLTEKVGRDADEWITERRGYGQNLRGLAAEVSDLIGSPVSRETLRRRLGLIEEHAEEDEAAEAS